jgi:modification methylase
MTSIWEIRPEMKSNHPAPFPLAIPTRIIYSIFSNETGKKIIDPFGGSGTTALAAHLLKHEYVSVDIDPAYSQMAKERINKNKDNYNLVTEEIGRHRVGKTYKERKAEKCE